MEDKREGEEGGRGVSKKTDRWEGEKKGKREQIRLETMRGVWEYGERVGQWESMRVEDVRE